MSNDDRRDDDKDWIETVVRLATSFGLSGVRVRWKLMGMRERWRRNQRRTVQQASHVRYEHAVCAHCGRVQDRSERTCVGCGQTMGARPWQLLQRFGFVIPNVGSVSTVLGILILISYFRVMIARPGSGYFSVDTDLLVRFGAYWLPALKAGEYWRLSTAVFLHIGLWHLGFNLVALAQIGPSIEDVFGRGRMVFFFMLTGIASFGACQLWGMQAPSAGASGAIMGLIGAAAGWGQRDGTAQARAVRNQMLKWGAYTMVFGMVIGANNIAHAGGFAVGALLGYLTPSRFLRRSVVRPADIVLGLVGMIAALATVALILRPPASSSTHMAAATQEAEQYDPDGDFDPSAYYRALAEACAMSDEGRDDAAIERLRRDMPKHEADGEFDKEQLDAQCSSFRRLVESCSRPWDEGALAKSTTRGGAVYGPRELRQMKQAWDQMCSEVTGSIRGANLTQADASSDAQGDVSKDAPDSF
jgi:rhomboid protease GluP